MSEDFSRPPGDNASKKEEPEKESREELYEEKEEQQFIADIFKYVNTYFSEVHSSEERNVQADIIEKIAKKIKANKLFKGWLFFVNAEDQEKGDEGSAEKELLYENQMFILCKKILQKIVEGKNAEIPSKKETEIAGEVFFENAGVKIYLDDPSKLNETDDWIKSKLNVIAEEAKQFRCSDVNKFIALIKVEKNIISIRMNPGSHKEFLGIIKNPDSDKDFCSYIFTPSKFEREKEMRQRKEFIQKISVRNIRDSFQEDKKGNAVINKFTVSIGVEDMFRLCQAVKNLDFLLNVEYQGEIDFLVNLFNAGATNLENFVSLIDRDVFYEEYLEKGDFSVSEKSINDTEKELAKRYFRYKEKLDEFKENTKETMQRMQELTELNYALLKRLDILLEMGKETLTSSVPNHHLAEEMRKSFAEIVDGLQKMFILGQDINSGFNVKKWRKCVEELAQIAQFGYGSQDVVNSNGEIDVSDAARIPSLARERYNNFIENVIEDRGKSLKDQSEVKSINEAVRYLHGLFIDFLLLNGSREVQFGDGNLQRIFHRDKMGEVLLFDSSEKRGKFGAGEVFKKALAKLGDSYLSDMRFGMVGGRAVLADNFFEALFEEGKHNIEVFGQMSPQVPEYMARFRYAESYYHGAYQRMDFVEEFLSAQGFRIQRNGSRTLKAVFRSQDIKKWEEGIEKLVYLIAIMKDLDLGFENEFPGGFNFLDLAQNGIVDRMSAEAFLSEFEKERPNINLVARRLAGILENGTHQEKIFYVEKLLEKSSSFSNWIEPILGYLDVKQLDTFLEMLYYLEDESKEKREGSKATLYRRLGEKVENLFDSKFKK